jgi:hypothetical protein
MPRLCIILLLIMTLLYAEDATTDRDSLKMVYPTMGQSFFVSTLKGYIEKAGYEARVVKLKNTSLLLVNIPKSKQKGWISFSLEPATLFAGRGYGMIPISMSTGVALHMFKRHLVRLNKHNLSHYNGRFYQNKNGRIEGSFILLIPPEGISYEAVVEGAKLLTDSWKDLANLIGQDF